MSWKNKRGKKENKKNYPTDFFAFEKKTENSYYLMLWSILKKIFFHNLFIYNFRGLFL